MRFCGRARSSTTQHDPGIGHHLPPSARAVGLSSQGLETNHLDDLSQPLCATCRRTRAWGVGTDTIPVAAESSCPGQGQHLPMVTHVPVPVCRQCSSQGRTCRLRLGPPVRHQPTQYDFAVGRRRSPLGWSTPPQNSLESCTLHGQGEQARLEPAPGTDCPGEGVPVVQSKSRIGRRRHDRPESPFLFGCQ